MFTGLIKKLSKVKKQFFDPNSQTPDECKFIDDETKKSMPKCSIEEIVIARNWKDFKKNQTISYEDVQDLNESDFAFGIFIFGIFNLITNQIVGRFFIPRFGTKNVMLIGYSLISFCPFQPNNSPHTQYPM